MGETKLPFVTTSIKGQPVTMATFLKQNPPNGKPMSTARRKNRKTDKPKVSENELPAIPQASAPRVTVLDGKIVVDESSLSISRDAKDSGQKQVVEETECHVTSSSFRSRQTPRDRWTEQDTQLFYESLSVWGTDFGLISKFLKNRTREQVKNKYKKEDRINPHKVHEYLLNRKSYDPTLFGIEG